MPTLKQRLGCWINEGWKTEFVIRAPGIAKSIGLEWNRLCNRIESISVDERTGGAIMHWADTSPLTVARFNPRVGGRLLSHCVGKWPIELSDTPPPATDSPDASIVIGVRGTGRLPQFIATLQSLNAQVGCGVEIIIVEQSWEPEFESIIPDGVRYIYTKSTHPKMPYNRSWALNVGVEHAKGRVVILHDGDMLVPTRFAASIAERMKDGLCGIKLPRFIFYLDQATSESVQTSKDISMVRQCGEVVQNNRTPIALTREAYLKIGGHDEAFYGWGGEDNEFIDRARTLEFADGAFLPIVHLWHQMAPKRKSGDRNAECLAAVMAKSPEQRVQELTRRKFGRDTPSVTWEPPAE